MTENIQNQEDLAVQEYHLDHKGILVVNSNYRMEKNNPKRLADGSIKMYWKCTNKACTGRANSIQIETVPGGPASPTELKMTQPHSCHGQSAMIKVRQAVHDITTAAASSSAGGQTLRTLYPQAKRALQLSDPVAADLMPSSHSLGSTVSRKKAESFPIVDKRMTVPIEFKDELGQTIGPPPHVDFVFLNELIPNTSLRMLVLGTREFFTKLVAAQVWYMDGTFGSMPAQPSEPTRFKQLFTIHIMVNLVSCIPVLYCFLPNKLQETYRHLFLRLKAKAAEFQLGEFQLERTMSDFESGLLPALRNEFPDMDQDGCFYHFCAQLYKHLSNYGLLVWSKYFVCVLSVYVLMISLSISVM
mgnify:CR=1 FL=1